MSQPSGNPVPNPQTGPSGGRSLFAAGAKLRGDLSVPGLMELLGHIDGKIFADAIMIEKGGSAIGELHAERVAVKGQLDGSIHGRDVTLHSSARVSGEIHYETLTIESGAEVDASCARRTRTSQPDAAADR